MQALALQLLCKVRPLPSTPIGNMVLVWNALKCTVGDVGIGFEFKLRVGEFRLTACNCDNAMLDPVRKLLWNT